MTRRPSSTATLITGIIAVVIALVAGATSASQARAAGGAGSVDPTFVSTSATGLNDDVNSIVVQPNGKILVGGRFTSYRGIPRQRIARLNANGTLDTTFKPTGTGLNSSVNSIAVQPNGKILVGGSFTSYNGTPRVGIARLNANGTLDTTFKPTGTGLDDGVNSMVVRPDGKILVGGRFTSYNGTLRRGIARLNANGTLDTTFKLTGTGLNNDVKSIVVQPDGKILVGGSFTSYNGTPRQRIARLNAHGTLDTTFTLTGTGLDGFVSSVVVRPTGKILVGGRFTSYNGTPRQYIARLNANGTLDTTFKPTGYGLWDWVSSVVVQPDGKILVGGSFDYYNLTPRQYIARLNANGTLDTTFKSTGTGLNNYVNSVALQPDGKILVGGSYDYYDGSPRGGIVRLNANGTLDTTFTLTGTGLDDGGVSSIVVQSNGKILVGGSFTSYNGTPRGGIARLNANGTLDTTFKPTGTGLDNNGVSSIVVQPDGKILVGGEFHSYNGTPRQGIARLNANGTLDTTFTLTGTGLDYGVSSIVVQSNGKILVGGSFTSYNGTPRQRIARLNANGTLDTTFTPTGTGLDYGDVSSIVVQSNGKILVGGSFTSYNGTPRQYIARLNADGTLDTTFKPTGTGLNNYVYSIAVQPDGKILVGGEFHSYNGTPRKRIARLNANGTLDTTFTLTGTGLDGSVYSIMVQQGGKILVGGAFTSYNGTPYAYLTRLLG